MKNSGEAAEYMNADREELERKILAKLVEYVDELPF
jgi:predicted house-cleaning noncanonical NTP pyrophosphatase (MazG superfamily)